MTTCQEDTLNTVQLSSPRGDSAEKNRNHVLMNSIFKEVNVLLKSVHFY
jgi:hypothetical protein